MPDRRLSKADLCLSYVRKKNKVSHVYKSCSIKITQDKLRRSVSADM